MFTMIRHVLLAVALCSLALALLSARFDGEPATVATAPVAPAR